MDGGNRDCASSIFPFDFLREVLVSCSTRCMSKSEISDPTPISMLFGMVVHLDNRLINVLGIEKIERDKNISVAVRTIGLCNTLGGSLTSTKHASEVMTETKISNSAELRHAVQSKARMVYCLRLFCHPSHCRCRFAVVIVPVGL